MEEEEEEEEDEKKQALIGKVSHVNSWTFLYAFFSGLSLKFFSCTDYVYTIISFHFINSYILIFGKKERNKIIIIYKYIPAERAREFQRPSPWWAM